MAELFPADFRDKVVALLASSWVSISQLSSKLIRRQLKLIDQSMDEAAINAELNKSVAANKVPAKVESQGSYNSRAGGFSTTHRRGVKLTRNHNGAHVLFRKITAGDSAALSVATVLLYATGNQVKATDNNRRPSTTTGDDRRQP